ncbi:hypothetical protein EDB81DRAFT_861956 [Dactylonectria macrodidyma]|uniref:Uncharacterized protein n=1 Tax=Dactylonectria macrodidyma TaxID=307937 RepID=A0A9P9DFJ5_9HYPO|nr:hypothetical protein EDB81DRAFT_861956 [Dactylonectria macrodidyma]
MDLISGFNWSNNLQDLLHNQGVADPWQQAYSPMKLDQAVDSAHMARLNRGVYGGQGCRHSMKVVGAAPAPLLWLASPKTTATITATSTAPSPTTMDRTFSESSATACEAASQGPYAMTRRAPQLVVATPSLVKQWIAERPKSPPSPVLRPIPLPELLRWTAGEVVRHFKCTPQERPFVGEWTEAKGSRTHTIRILSDLCAVAQRERTKSSVRRPERDADASRPEGHRGRPTGSLACAYQQALDGRCTTGTTMTTMTTAAATTNTATSKWLDLAGDVLSKCINANLGRPF